MEILNLDSIFSIIKSSLFKPDNALIRVAVTFWCENREKALIKYGHISIWDTLFVTNM